MLINLTNHPFKKWGEKQHQTTINSYQSVVDIPFPMIDAKATKKQIGVLALAYKKEIQTYLNDENKQNFAVHLMGEQTFCYALITLLKKENIKVIASTTERNVIDLGDGKREIKFEFIQFREY